MVYAAKRHDLLSGIEERLEGWMAVGKPDHQFPRMVDDTPGQADEGEADCLHSLRDPRSFLKGEYKTFLLKSARANSRVMATLIVIAICFFVNNEGYRDWAKTAGVNVNADSEMTRLGVRIRQCTEADSRVAVVWAGALPYFSRRYSVDLLGKCDPVIARGNPKGKGFYPGHNKWDYVYSIERYQPDLIVQLWQQNSEDVKEILSHGYVETKDGYFVKKGSLAKMGCLLSSTSPRPSGSVDEHPQGG